jgi:hypothetical protein
MLFLLCINPTIPTLPDLQGQSIRVDFTVRLVLVETKPTP